MRRIFIILFLTISAITNNVFATAANTTSKAYDVWTSMPDSICNLKEYAEITEHNDSVLKAKTSEVSNIELVILPYSADNTLSTVVCLIKTYRAPEAESIIELYDMEWNKINNIIFNVKEIFPEIPDAEKLFVPLLVNATISGNQELKVSISQSLLSEEDKKEFQEIVLQKTLKWNGETFK